MKSSLIVFALLSLASCGRSHHAGPSAPPAPVPNGSILSKFEAIVDGGSGPVGTPAFTGLHGITSLDYSAISLGVETDVSAFCPYNLGNSGTVGPENVNENQALLDGTSEEGILQYGHLGYVKPDSSFDSLCRDLSKERYTYKMTGDVLKLCMVNYPYCATYRIVL